MTNPLVADKDERFVSLECTCGSTERRYAKRWSVAAVIRAWRQLHSGPGHIVIVGGEDSRPSFLSRKGS